MRGVLTPAALAATGRARCPRPDDVRGLAAEVEKARTLIESTKPQEVILGKSLLLHSIHALQNLADALGEWNGR